MTTPDDPTIFALSSGQPPAGIAVVRISGANAGSALRSLAGRLPPPRRAVLRTLRDGAEMLDRALVLWLPGPATVTGEDMAELHLHGGRAVVNGVERALAAMPRLRRAEAGEFTRRALYNGRIDLTAAEGLADLLAAETASQRRAALLIESGGLARRFDEWRHRLLTIAAQVEASIDLAEEAEAADEVVPVAEIAALAGDIATALARPPAERLRDGVRVVLAGPVNSGKSTLLNALVGRDAAIATPIAGTTRDVLEAPMAIAGVPFVFVDTAGLRGTADPVEAEGVARAGRAVEAADILVWMGDGAAPPVAAPVIAVHGRADLPERAAVPVGRMPVSAVSPSGVDALRDLLLATAAAVLPREGEVALASRHRTLLGLVHAELTAAEQDGDALLVGERLRHSLALFARLTGEGDVEDVLDAMFARFCVGK